jgi:prolycopene isomerase
MHMTESVIIIGGGLGGLTAAVAAAARGRQVTVIEKELHAGGFAVAYQRGGYHFDVALHVVPAGGPGQAFRWLVDELGLEGIRFIRLATGSRVILGEREFRLPNSAAGFFAALTEAFPGQAKGLQRLRGELLAAGGAYAPLFDVRVPTLAALPRFLPRLPAFLMQSYQSTESYLARFVADANLAALLYQPAVFLGQPMAEFPAVNYILMAYLLLTEGMYSIAGGGQTLTAALLRRLEALGGVVRRGTVRAIRVQRGRALGVTLADGDELDAAALVSAINLPTLWHDLLPPDLAPAAVRSALGALRPSLSVLNLNLGLDCAPQALGIQDHLTVRFPDAQLDECLRKQRNGEFAGGFSITAPGLSEPEAAPARGHTLSVVAGASGAWWNRLAPGDYQREKGRLCEAIMAQVSALIPGLAAHVRCQDLATPVTLQRYTGAPQGAIMGFEPECGRHRALLRAARSPLPNLHLAGAWTDRMGGFLQSMMAGHLAGRRATA